MKVIEHTSGARIIRDDDFPEFPYSIDIPPSWGIDIDRLPSHGQYKTAGAARSALTRLATNRK